METENLPPILACSAMAIDSCLGSGGYEAAWSASIATASAVGWATAGDLAIPSSEARYFWTPQAESARDQEFAAQVALLRDVFGNPFHPVALDRSWLMSAVVSSSPSHLC
jgi:hypothetical protein